MRINQLQHLRGGQPRFSKPNPLARLARCCFLLTALPLLSSACAAQTKNFTAKNIAPRQEAVWRIEGQRVVIQYRHADGRRALQTNAYQIVRGALEVAP